VVSATPKAALKVALRALPVPAQAFPASPQLVLPSAQPVVRQFIHKPASLTVS